MLSHKQWHATIFPSTTSLNGRWLVRGGCFTSCKIFQPFYEETQKPTKSRISFCQVLQLPKSFTCIAPERTLSSWLEVAFFFSPVDLLVVQQRTMAMPWCHFCSIESGGATTVMMTLTTLILVMPLGILGVLILKRRHFTDRWRKPWKRWPSSPKKRSSWIHFKMVDLSGPKMFAIRNLQDGNQAFNMFFGRGINFLALCFPQSHQSCFSCWDSAEVWFCCAWSTCDIDILSKSRRNHWIWCNCDEMSSRYAQKKGSTQKNVGKNSLHNFPPKKKTWHFFQNLKPSNRTVAEGFGSRLQRLICQP